MRLVRVAGFVGAEWYEPLPPPPAPSVGNQTDSDDDEDGAASPKGDFKSAYVSIMAAKHASAVNCVAARPSLGRASAPSVPPLAPLQRAPASGAYVTLHAGHTPRHSTKGDKKRARAPSPPSMSGALKSDGWSGVPLPPQPMPQYLSSAEQVAALFGDPSPPVLPAGPANPQAQLAAMGKGGKKRSMFETL